MRTYDPWTEHQRAHLCPTPECLAEVPMNLLKRRQWVNSECQAALSTLPKRGLLSSLLFKTSRAVKTCSLQVSCGKDISHFSAGFICTCTNSTCPAPLWGELLFPETLAAKRETVFRIVWRPHSSYLQGTDSKLDLTRSDNTPLQGLPWQNIICRHASVGQALSRPIPVAIGTDQSRHLLPSLGRGGSQHRKQFLSYVKPLLH